jgi:hypothetical protein
MKLVTILAAVLLSGCSALHFSGTAVLSYNMPTAVQAGVVQPGAK